MNAGEILLGFVVPGVIAGVLWLGAWLVWRLLRSERAEGGEGERTSSGAAGAWMSAPAAALAMTPAFVVLNGYHWTFWPQNGTLRVLPVLALVGVVGLIESFVWKIAPVRHALRAGVFAGVVVITIPPLPPHVVSTEQLIALAVGIGVGFAMLAHAVDAAAHRVRGAGFAGMMLPWALAAGPALFFSGYANGARLGSALVPILIATMVVGVFFYRQMRFARGGVTALLGVMLQYLLIAQFYNENTPTLPLLLLALAPLGAAAALLVPGKSERVWLRPIVGGVAVAAIAAAAAYSAWTLKPEEPENPWAAAPLYDAGPFAAQQSIDVDRS